MLVQIAEGEQESAKIGLFGWFRLSPTVRSVSSTALMPKIYNIINSASNTSPGALSFVGLTAPGMQTAEQRTPTQHCTSTDYDTPTDKIAADDIIVPRRIWIHPQLRDSALLTCRVLLGDAAAMPSTEMDLQRVVFPEFAHESPSRRIVDKFDILLPQRNRGMALRFAQIMNALDIEGDPEHMAFADLLRWSKIKSLTQVFVTFCDQLLNLTYQGSVLDSIVIPAVYKVMGEQLLSPQRSDDYNSNLKQTFTMIVLAIAALTQYRENKVAAQPYLKCFIALREMSLIGLSRLIQPLIGEYDEDEPIEIKNKQFVDTLVATGHIKELFMTLILAIVQDEQCCIIENYQILYSVLEGVREYLLGKKIKDTQLDLLMAWFKYIYFFFRSTSTIDVKHYQIKEKGFEDLDSDYNMIKKFTFDDSYPTSGYSKIQIESREFKTEESDDESLERPVLPKRLANRPQLEDKPPRSFTIKFRFNDESSDSDSESGWTSIGSETVINEEGHEVNAVTGLAKASGAPKREQDLENRDLLLKIPDPFDINKVKGIYPIELSYGIPMSLMDIMMRVVVISDHKNWFERKRVFPRNFPKFCCDLEEELMTWKLPWVLYEEVDGKMNFFSDLHEALFHLIIAFYNTTVMYFFRIVKETDPSLLQGHVESTIHHLEELHRVQSDQFQVALPYWCFFICGSDAIDVALQERYYRLHSVWHQWMGDQMILEVWRGRNVEDQVDSSWLDMIKGWELSGFH